MTHPLHTATPSAAGVDAAGILRFLDALEASPTQDPHGLMVLRHGRVVAQGWWAPYSSARPQLVYSLSKSLTAAAAGVLYDDGVLDLDARVTDFFSDDAAGSDGAGGVDGAERTGRMLVRHAATMSTGHVADQYESLLEEAVEPVRGFLRRAPEREPGTVFAYNAAATYTLAAIVQQLSGTTLVELLRKRVLDPVGAAPIAWRELPAGRTQGFSGAFVTTGTIARLGQLLLRRGLWGDRRVLSAEWVDLATRVHVETAASDVGPDWRLGYGIQHWRSRHGYRGDGAFGQFCLVLPEHDAVVAIQSQTEHAQETLDLVWEHLLPAFENGGSPEADRELAARLAELMLPPLRVPGGADPDAGWDGCDLRAEAGGWLSARVHRSPEGWRLALSDGTTEVDAAFDAHAGAPGWRVTEADGQPAVALSGGFETSDLLRLDAAFLETPHRLHVELDRAAGVVRARWQTAPLRHEHDLGALAAPHPFG